VSDATVLSGPTPAGWRKPGPIDQLRNLYGRLRYRYFPPKSNLEHFAERELARLMGDPDGDEMQIAMNKHILKMVRQFGREGHSGFSASYAIGCLEKLLRYEPLTPLTGEDDEWMCVSEMAGEEMWQNTRCGRIFKGGDGRAYDIEGKVFVEPSGAAFTSRDSRVYIKFPYQPTTEHVSVDDDGQPIGGGER
jgi:hypothetical protein